MLTAHQELPDLDRRLTELQSQINRLSLSMHLWQERQDRLFEQRLIAWNAVETNAQKEASERLNELQTTIQNEWHELRLLREDPLQQLQLLETNINDRLSELSDQVQAAVIELRTLSGQRPEGVQQQTPSWPLEDVVRLHNQLRESDDSAGAASQAIATRTPAGLAELPAGFRERLETLERALTDGQSEIRQAAERGTTFSRLGWAAIFVLVVAGATAGTLANRMRRQVDDATARATAAEQQARVAVRTATEQVAAARETASQQISEAKDVALRAQMISAVLAAPDLVRYTLVSGDGTAAYTAQALWSRSSGLVLSGSRLPAPPANSTYQVWLLTASAPTAVGTFVPDESGHVSTAMEAPPRVLPVLGVTVTVERAGGAERPTGPIVLVRAQPAPAPPTGPAPDLP